MSLAEDTFFFRFDDPDDGFSPSELDVYEFLSQSPGSVLTAGFFREKDHPRDADGRFTDSFTGIVKDAVPQASWQQDKRLNDKLGDTTVGKIDSALGIYGSQRYQDINGQLREKKGNLKKVEGSPTASPGSIAHTDNMRAQIHALDVGMENSKLTKDIQVTRVLRDPAKVFGKAWKREGDNAGLTWKDDGFISTSPDAEYAKRYAQGDVESIQMRLHVPKGTGALYLEQQTDTDTSLEQVVLDRGLRFRVVRDNGIVNGLRQLDVEVL